MSGTVSTLFQPWRAALLVLATSVATSAAPIQAAKPASGPDAADKKSAPAGPEYVIGAGDVLHVFVWKEPELTRDLTVRMDGKITVPLLGDIEAAGRTPQQLGKDLARELARFLEAPQVTVGVGQSNSTRFYVVGNVGKPGEFPLGPRLTFLQALALAGGFREYAKSDSIVIVRDEKGFQTVIPVNYKKIEAGREISTQNVLLRPGDVVVVP